MGKFYGVIRGNNVENEIYSNWGICKQHIQGCKGALYKSFETRREAEEYLRTGKRITKKSDHKYNDEWLHCYVDGSYNQSTQEYGYSLVIVSKDIVVYTLFGKGKEEVPGDTRQVAGEIAGAIHAARVVQDAGEKELVIFHDYEGIAQHGLGTWKAEKQYAKDYRMFIKDKLDKGMDILFARVDGHSADIYNEVADELAKFNICVPSNKELHKSLSSNILKVATVEIKQQLESILGGNMKNIIVEGVI